MEAETVVKQRAEAVSDIVEECKKRKKKGEKIEGIFGERKDEQESEDDPKGK